MNCGGSLAELRARGHRVAGEFSVQVFYKGDPLGFQRLDMVVDDVVVVESKASFELHRASTRQVYGYLCATRLTVGLLLHFGPEPQIFRVDRNGYRRMRRKGPRDASSHRLDLSDKDQDVKDG